LSYILDGLHEDLNKVKQKEIVENLDFDGSNDKEDSLKAWNNYLKRNKSII
jgi:ubiquitin carboxyl-terminal hydrolase 4/11